MTVSHTMMLAALVTLAIPMRLVAVQREELHRLLERHALSVDAPHAAPCASSRGLVFSVHHIPCVFLLYDDDDPLTPHTYLENAGLLRDTGARTALRRLLHRAHPDVDLSRLSADAREQLLRLDEFPPL